jgi:hypothetical protein
METRSYAGKVLAVYRAEPRSSGLGVPFTEGQVIALFDSREGAETYIDKRKTQDRYRNERYAYSIIPWLVQS